MWCHHSVLWCYHTVKGIEMTERHQYIGELTVENVDKYLTRLTRKRITRVLTDEGGLNADIVALRTDFLGIDPRDVLAAMVADGTVVRNRGKHHMNESDHG